ncbi:MAG: hypothetical protein IJI01_09320 [Butyrivibrio sp.]|uniref:hypothetical protein n=1 Tax=Butyrivibrio sp. TaxID=28121 RepID=UPI0025B9569E|nr:hypothetical protein [Butyrivibrio sp.]MBQ6588866.1 hypothetical protein [Butyrivibrio sp.]
MKKYRLITILGLILYLTGCADKAEVQEETSLGASFEHVESIEAVDAIEMSDETKELGSTDENSISEGESNDEIYDKFLAGEISAVGYFEGSKYEVWFNELPQDPEEWDSYSVSDEKIDLDNDGETELILNGPYGGMYLDARDGGVYVLAQGEGTAGELSYTVYEGRTYITHRDVSHGGRQIYWFDLYDGTGAVVDSFELSAEYWDSDDDSYDENSDFTYRGEKITMDEYEKLMKEILGVDND